MDSSGTLGRLIVELTGERRALQREPLERAVRLFRPSGQGIGLSQFNELLILLGYHRVDRSFFAFLARGRSEYAPGMAIRSLRALQTGVDRFQKAALLFYGNFRFAFRRLSTDRDELEAKLRKLSSRAKTEFRKRHRPVSSLVPIPGKDAHLLGFVSGALAPDGKSTRVLKVAEANLRAYLASDHLDVYVATSMRAPHEYQFVHDFTRRLFAHRALEKLNLRWFDPTQGSTTSRLDKGLAEALMLKRVKCTLYLAQESDTLGKDSELASTLAQGKVVIAFVPSARGGAHVSEVMHRLRNVYPGEPERALVLRYLRELEPQAAWTDPEVRSWIDNPETFDLRGAHRRLQASARRHYDERANRLQGSHPLGIQVHLETGVANGVLVVRTLGQCAELLRRVVLGRLDFRIHRERRASGAGRGATEHVVLRETVSGCIFRVITGDEYLTNAFWNFYLRSTA